jgi:archaellum component FlaC
VICGGAWEMENNDETIMGLKKDIETLQTTVKELKGNLDELGAVTIKFSRTTCDILGTLTRSQENLSKDVLNNMRVVSNLAVKMETLFSKKVEGEVSEIYA